MELSLLSREVIAMSAAVGLPITCLMVLCFSVCATRLSQVDHGSPVVWSFACGVCAVWTVASGLPNKEKVRIRQLYAEGKWTAWHYWSQKPRLIMRREQYFLRYCQHQPDGGGVYGDAVPGSSFVHPDSPLRDALTAALRARLRA